MLRIPRAIAIVLAAVALSLMAAGCSSGATPPTTTVATAPADNVFIPTGQNLSDCVGTLELPNCGSEAQSDVRLYLTFAALMGGMALIGWRIWVGIRKRDHDDVVPDHTF